MARASREDSEATARLILAQARALFAQRGYAGVSLEEVALASAVTRGAVYHHFASKKGLFEAVATLAQQRVAAAVVVAAESTKDPWEGLSKGCQAFLSASLSDESRQILLIDAPSVLGWNSWRRQDAEASGAHLSETIEELAEAGAISIRSVASATALLSGAMNEAALCIAQSPKPTEAMDDVLGDLFSLMDGLRVSSRAELGDQQV